jgi:hypothetical protein
MEGTIKKIIVAILHLRFHFQALVLSTPAVCYPCLADSSRSCSRCEGLASLCRFIRPTHVVLISRKMPRRHGKDLSGQFGHANLLEMTGVWLP